MTENLNSNSAFYVRFNKGYELMEKHPQHVPVMFNAPKEVNLEKETVMCPRDTPLSNLVLQFRKYLAATPDGKSPTMGFVFRIKHNNTDVLPKLTETMGELHDKYHSSDMWLVLKIEKEDIFG